MKRRIGWVFLVFVISAAVIYFVVAQIDLSPLLQLRASTILLCLGLLAVSIVVYVAPIWSILRDMGCRTSVWHLFLVLGASHAANYLAFAKVGIPVRVYLYRRALGVPVATGTACVVLANFVWLVFILLAALLGVFLISTGLDPVAVLAIMVGIVVLLVAVVRVPISVTRPLVTRIPGRRLWVRILDFLEALQAALRKVSASSLVFLILVVALKLWLQGFTIYLILRELEAMLTLWQVLGALAISLGAGIATLIPMGAGTQDVSFVLLLTSLGVSQEAAVSVALVDRILFTAIPFVIGMLCANLLTSRFLQGYEEVCQPECTGQE
jgi:uncharacterized protein (TIRG00374 family)